MGNCPPAPACCSSGSSSSSTRQANKFQLLDDDWADEIWYDAVQYHPDENDNGIDNLHRSRSRSSSGGGQLQHDDDDDHVTHEQVFDVTDEEIQILQDTLAERFPQEAGITMHEIMSTAYLRSVASKPYSKDMTRRRPLEYSLEKLTHVMEWRQEMHASELPAWIRACAGNSDTRKDNENNNNNNDDITLDADTMKRARAMVESLNTGSMYWHGLTPQGRPILWIRTNRKFWYPNVQAEVDALIVMAEAGIRYGMPTGITDFVCLSHSYKPPPPHPPFAYQMLRGLVKGFPDRMHLLVSAPVSSIVEFCMNLLLPLMPGRLAHKFCFYSLDHVRTQLKDELLWHGQDDIPTFFGGPANHDQYYPATYSNHSNSKKGSLKFDWYGMVERLKEQKKRFEQQQEQQQGMTPS